MLKMLKRQDINRCLLLKVKDIMFVFLLKVKEFRFVPSGGGDKISMDKNKEKMDNDIFFLLFFLLMFNIPSMLKSLRALSPTFKNETRIARMQRILSFHVFLLSFDLNLIFLRLSALDSSS